MQLLRKVTASGWRQAYLCSPCGEVHWTRPGKPTCPVADHRDFTPVWIER
jgi:hypothetical protein